MTDLAPLTLTDAAAEVATVRTDLLCIGPHSDIAWITTVCCAAAALLARTEAARVTANEALRNENEQWRIQHARAETAEREREELRKALREMIDAGAQVIAACGTEGTIYQAAAEVSQRQTCKACGMVDYWDFTIPDDLWASIVPPELRSRVVCLPCFDRMAANKGIKYAAGLRAIYFSGEMEAFEFVAARTTDARSGEKKQ